MAVKAQSNPSSYNKDDRSALAKLIKERLKFLGMTQKDLAEASQLSESMISRIVNNKDVFISEYRLNQLAVALQMGKEGRDRMRYYVNPKLDVFDAALQEHVGNVVEVNCMLVENGFSPVGNDFLE